jgi:HEAT repeat protein
MKLLGRRLKVAIPRTCSVFLGLVLSISFSGCSAVSEENLAGLRSQNHIVKLRAIEAIGKAMSSQGGLFDLFFSRTKEEEAVNVLVELLRSNKESDNVEVKIIAALGRFGRTKKVPMKLLLEKLRDDNLAIRVETIQAFARLQSKEATAALIKLLEEDNNSIVIWALGEIGDATAIPVLNGLSQNKDKFVSYNAYKALAKIGSGNVNDDHTSSALYPSSHFLAAGIKPFEQYQTAMKIIFQAIERRNRS